eukprot:CAMPEP_0194290570 /NCGR_PEP_ID=MMETSP0169-20130528/41521_1 /TAXON_ID=218684 /ORGANISM="Corethron pennatum, Strain L29A3" /LENGTH=117 /DNA_ID=CAMNT_0039038181 /DNA_START=124 /DNA_END=477 /DNA_ORIENTATION=-
MKQATTRTSEVKIQVQNEAKILVVPAAKRSALSGPRPQAPPPRKPGGKLGGMAAASVSKGIEAAKCTKTRPWGAYGNTKPKRKQASGTGVFAPAPTSHMFLPIKTILLSQKVMGRAQ